MSLLKFIRSKWWIYGLYWGLGMWLGTIIIWPMFGHEKYSLADKLLGLIFYGAFGLFWGWASTPREEAEASDNNSKPDLP